MVQTDLKPDVATENKRHAAAKQKRLPRPIPKILGPAPKLAARDCRLFVFYLRGFAAVSPLS